MEFKTIPFYNDNISEMGYGFEITRKGGRLIEMMDEYYRMPMEDRAENFSYLILEYALRIEDLAHIETYDHLKLCDVKIEKIYHGKYGLGTGKSWTKWNQLKLLSQELSLSIYKKGKKEPFCYKSFTMLHQKIVFKYDDMCNRKKFEPFPGEYEIKFIPNRSSFRVCYHALKCMKDYNLELFFEKFEDVPKNNVLKSIDEVEKFEWFDEKISSNKEQIIAIKNIVNCTAFPLPFVIFGPPGTGKTSTLVECIAQIIVHKPTSHILISAQSNSACDEIGKRLMKVVSYNKIFRFQSSYNLKSTDKEQFNILNSYCPDQYPSYEELYHFSIVIVTLSMSSRLIQAHVKKDHFDYIFIDECGAASEPESLVPIIGKINCYYK